MDELIAALKSQTEALNRLAESNEALLVAMLADDVEPRDDDGEPGETYLDARPAQTTL